MFRMLFPYVSEVGSVRLCVSDELCSWKRLSIRKSETSKASWKKKRQCNSEKAYEAIFLCVSNDVCQPFSNSGFFLCLINVWR